jgi:outer membrane biosynthesis protein TonB
VCFDQATEVDEYGYIYKHIAGKKEREMVGYLARPSKPHTPTLHGERTWRSLWLKCTLCAYAGMPNPELDKKEKKKCKRKEKKNNQEQQISTPEPKQSQLPTETPVEPSAVTPNEAPKESPVLRLAARKKAQPLPIEQPADEQVENIAEGEIDVATPQEEVTTSNAMLEETEKAEFQATSTEDPIIETTIVAEVESEGDEIVDEER